MSYEHPLEHERTIVDTTPRTTDPNPAHDGVTADSQPNSLAVPAWWRLVCPWLFLAHLAFALATLGFRVEIVVVDLLFVGLWYAGPRARSFTFDAFGFWFAGLWYLHVMGWMLRFRGDIHVGDLYRAEQALFGIGPADEVPALWFLDHTAPLLDFICGVAYIAYVWVPVGIAIYFFVTDRRQMRLLVWAFFLTMALGSVVYTLYPAAPPWYVLDYGLGPVNLDAAPSAAGAARFDALTGGSYFAEFYARNENVFGAMPSLHVAWPALAFFGVSHKGWRWAFPTGAFVLLVAFAAVYLQHHYILDLIAGVAIAFVAYWAAKGGERAIRAYASGGTVSNGSQVGESPSAGHETPSGDSALRVRE